MHQVASKTRWLLALVLLVAAVLRLTYLLEITDAPDFASPRFEAQYHDYWARALVSGDWTPPEGVTDPEIQQRPYFRPPGYPFFLAAIYAATGPGYLLPRLLQMALGLASVGLLFGLGRRMFGETAGLAAAAMMALYWVSLYFEGELMAPSLLIFLLLAFTSLVVRWTDGLTPRLAAASGLVLGLTVLVRPNVLVLLPVCCLWLLWLARRRLISLAPPLPLAPPGSDAERREGIGRVVRRVVGPGLIFAVATLLAVLPATLRNAWVADDAVLVTSNAGINLFVGTHPDSDGFNPGVPELGELLGDSGWESFDQPKIVAAVSAEVGRPLKDSEVSGYFSRQALDYMTSQPVAVLRLWGRKLLLFLSPHEISNTKVLTMERRTSPTLGLGLDFATVLALALLGSILLLWQRHRSDPSSGGSRGWSFAVLLWLCLGATTASYLPFFVSARFRLPLVPWMMLLAGAGLGIVWRWMQSRHWRQVALVLSLAVVLRWLTGMVWIPYTPDEALWHSRRARLYLEAQQTDRAIEAYQQALEVDPQRLTALLPLADSLVEAQRPDEAITVYQTALALDPQNLAGHNNLAMVLARRGQTAQAVEHWRTVLRLDGRRLSAKVNLAATLATSPDPEVRNLDEALELAEQALALSAGQDPRVRSLVDRIQQARVAESKAQGL